MDDERWIVCDCIFKPPNPRSLSSLESVKVEMARVDDVGKDAGDQ